MPVVHGSRTNLPVTRGEHLLGAIIGDIVGSVYERHPIKTKDFPFFADHCFFTDDSVCTVAVADILLHDLPPAETLQKWCQRYSGCGYGGYFSRWIYADPPEPYNSYGTGAAMRVSAAAFLNRDDLAAALAAADEVTEITHNHPEGMKGARATTHAIWLAFHGENPADIRQAITFEYGYDLTKTVDEIRPDYFFDMTCQGTVPQAITCALESISYEDAVRNAISLGGDADTLAAIAGAIAEAMHSIPDALKRQAEDRYLTEASDMLEVLHELYAFMTNVVRKQAVIPSTAQHYMIELPAPKVVRRAILELEYPSDGLRVVTATERLAEKFQLSDEQKHAKNSSDLNVFRYDVVAPQFKRLLSEGKLKQSSGPRTPYFLAESDPDLPVVELRETSSQPEWPSVERTALDPDTGEEHQIALPGTDIVKQAFLDFDYPPSGIRIMDIAEALADQFELTEEQREAKGKYGLVWKRHVNIAANSLVSSGQLLSIKHGWISNPDQYSKLSPSGTESSDNQYDVFISHATEDKDEIVRPLVNILTDQGLRVWYDEFELRIGDSLKEKIEEGLANSRYGIVVLSHAFFQKKWPKYELNALVAREMADKPVILPIWHNITEDEIMAYSPGLTDKIALNTSNAPIDEIAQEIAKKVQNARGPLSK